MEQGHCVYILVKEVNLWLQVKIHQILVYLLTMYSLTLMILLFFGFLVICVFLGFFFKYPSFISFTCYNLEITFSH